MRLLLVCIFVLCILVHVTNAQEVNLTSTLIQGRYALSGRRVTFTCEARGTEVMEWVSEDYIGAGGDLIEIFSQDDGSNQTRREGMTVATRVGVHDDNGITVIISQLHITASDQFPMSSVTCRINGRGPSTTVNFNITDLTALQDIVLTSTLVQGRYALSGRRVTFTCEARGTEVMEWVSEDYIGAGGDLIEIFSQDDGSNQTRLRGMTVATRTGVYDDNGITVIVSQLHIIASDQFPMSSVTCRINGRGPSTTVRFNTTVLAALQDIMLTSTLIQGRYALSGERVTFTCEARGTEVMEWVSEDYIGAGGDLIEIFSRDDGSNQTRLRGMTIATRVGVNDDNGITVIISQLHITASDQFPISSVTCRINGRGPSKTVRFNITDSIPTTTDSVVMGNVSNVTTVSEAPVSEGKDGAGLIAGITILVIIILGIAFFLFVVYIRWNHIVQQLRKCRGLMMVSSGESAKELEENRPEADNKNEQLNETVENQESKLNDGKVEDQGESKSEAENKQLNRTVKNQGIDEVDQAHGNSIPDRRDPSGLKTLLNKESNNEKVKGEGGSGLEAVIERLETTVKEHEQQSRKLMAERDELKNKLNDEKREGKQKDEQIHHLKAELERVKAELERVKAKQAEEVQSLLAKIERLAPKVENETVQDSDSKQKSDRDGGVIEPADNVNGECVPTLKQEWIPSQSMFEGPPGDLISFKGPAPDVIKNSHGSKAVGGLIGVGGLVSGVIGVTGGIVGVLLGAAIAVIGALYIIKKESNDDSERKKKEEGKKTIPHPSPTIGPAPDPAVSRDSM